MMFLLITKDLRRCKARKMGRKRQEFARVYILARLMSIQSPKGTFDILPYGASEPWRLSAAWQGIEALVRATAALYGYQEIRTPLFERRELFDRGIGETSDIVSKEMFTFQDKGGRDLCLRPEGTASVMRAFIESHLDQIHSVHKFFYIGPMFRYERPQSGRYRQHHQFGVEVIGVAGYEQDAEVIDLLLEIYRRLGLKNLKVLVNTVGDLPTRLAYRQALQDYLRPHFSSLSEDSRERFEKNPLRILDSKDPTDKELIVHAPSILEYLSQEAKEHFEGVCRLLGELGICYEINDRVVRGLDYYQKTVFEVVTEGLGSQNTVGAGGRFDGLLSTFHGPNLPGIGFGTGLERVMQTMLAQQIALPKNRPTQVVFIPLEGRARALHLATECRRHEISAEVDLQSKKLGHALQAAAKMGARFAAILGEEEMKTGTVQLKNLETREASLVPFHELVPLLRRLCFG
jgi:histidyl-tRNA synthetase